MFLITDFIFNFNIFNSTILRKEKGCYPNLIWGICSELRVSSKESDKVMIEHLIALDERDQVAFDVVGGVSGNKWICYILIFKILGRVKQHKISSLIRQEKLDLIVF